ncbi:exported hypothetical protein [Serratia proteamaculans]|uniref:hypothetical protein n=1 Tax=Serratia proteamaculans TaxID=28151 RepID=UPI0009F7AEB6|nr:hypothetical protein [Serratia proteamaculans]SMB40894.1 exported hypothetical protein [Serratia proteamaculans]
MKRESRMINTLLILFIACVLIVIGSYTANFRNFSISNNPADWGVLGDYFGGVLNPLISIVTLFFLIKTYLSQKQELHQSEMSAQEQREMSLKMARIQLLQTKISASYEIIAVYRQEMEGVTVAMNAPGNGRAYTGIDGIRYFSDKDQKKYRLIMASKVQKVLVQIDEYLSELDK